MWTRKSQKQKYECLVSPSLTSYRHEAVSVGAEKVLWHGHSAPRLEPRPGLELGLTVGYVPACVRLWALFPALPATNERANSKLSLRSVPWHPDQFIHSTGPAKNLSNSRENSSSAAWGLRLSVAQLCISIPITFCGGGGTRNQTQGIMQTF